MTPALQRALDLHQPAVAENSGFERHADEVRAQNRLRASLLDDDWPKKIAAFRQLFGLSKFDNESPNFCSPLRDELHRGLFAEEFAETVSMLTDDKDDLVLQVRAISPYQERTLDALAEQIDGILDTIYVGLGWLAEIGLTPAEINLCMQEVHASNLTKVNDDGSPLYDKNGKVLKGDNYACADIVGLLRQFISSRIPQMDGDDGTLLRPD